jgi:uncharacterized protein YlxP (DUF503 family)
MVIALLTARVSIPEAHSLKDKRQVLKSLKDRMRNRLNVSVAEVGRQDAWQHGELAFATVAADMAAVEERFADVDRFLHSDPRLVLVSAETEFL